MMNYGYKQGRNLIDLTIIGQLAQLKAMIKSLTDANKNGATIY